MDCSLWLDTHTARECFDLLARSAVSSGEHGVGIDQKSSAKRRAEVQKQGLSVKKHFTNRDKICTCSVRIIILYTRHQRNATEAVGFCQMYICCIKDLLFGASGGEKSLALTFNHRPSIQTSRHIFQPRCQTPSSMHQNVISTW